MTLNQIVTRIRLICTAHKQLRSFYFGLPVDFLTDKTTRYASVFMQDSNGVIDLARKEVVVNFKLYLLDLVNVAASAKENELDVQSDMFSVAKDLLAEFDDNGYTDWAVSGSNVVALLREEFDDLVAGVSVDLSIRTQYDKDTCEVPTDALPDIPVPNPEDMKLVYDITYVSNGAETTTLSVPELVGKKILFATRNNTPIYKVSNAPDTTQYTWNDVIVTLGLAVNNDDPASPERFLFLYRNY